MSIRATKRAMSSLRWHKIIENSNTETDRTLYGSMILDLSESIMYPLPADELFQAQLVGIQLAQVLVGATYLI